MLVHLAQEPDYRGIKRENTIWLIVATVQPGSAEVGSLRWIVFAIMAYLWDLLYKDSSVGIHQADTCYQIKTLKNVSL